MTRAYSSVRCAILGAVAVLAVLAAPGCVTIEGGLKYEYAGRLLKEDGKTPVDGAAVRLARTTAPEQSDGSAKTDKAPQTRSNEDGRYRGTVETKKGWSYSQVFGAHVGPTRAPQPPPLGEVVVYVRQEGGSWIGYRVALPAESQAEASSGVRKVQLPDLLLPEVAPTTRPANRPADAPAGP